MITRFAPSPTGSLHLGHAYSAYCVWQMAAQLNGVALLRIEDTDSTRCKPEYCDAIFEDLAWLGFHWPNPVRLQSEYLDTYRACLDRLSPLTYPCSCTRRDIKTAGATLGHEGYVYPGTCRDRHMSSAKPTDAIRLDLRRAVSDIGPMRFTDVGPLQAGTHILDPDDMLANQGDPVLRRPENQDIAYLLACACDDHAQAITHVVRGVDLWHTTPLQVVLQTLLGWDTPTYCHHDLIRDKTGKRLAKVDRSRALSTYRAAGATPATIFEMFDGMRGIPPLQS